MKRTLVQKLGLLGVVSFLSYALAVIFSPLAYPGYHPLAQAVSAEQDEGPQQLENGALVYALHVPAAEEGESGVCAATTTIRLRVKAEAAQDNLKERLLGASLAWDVDGGEAQLGEAVALRVHSDSFLGLTRGEWNGVFWAALLLAATIACLCAAVHTDKSDEDYSFE